MIIRISNIDRSIKKKQVKELFSRYGRVKNVIVHGRKGFVYMPDRSDGMNAVDELDGTVWKGNEIKVQMPGGTKTQAVCHTPIGFFRLR